ncbi:hypothetical protein DFP73DRAFT_175107 [Morchella snyderi]|nr:hypothetical protein DFP73DRAFT_175107 [Morchella snyderi]
MNPFKRTRQALPPDSVMTNIMIVTIKIAKDGTTTTKTEFKTRKAQFPDPVDRSYLPENNTTDAILLLPGTITTITTEVSVRRPMLGFGDTESFTNVTTTTVPLTENRARKSSLVLVKEEYRETPAPESPGTPEPPATPEPPMTPEPPATPGTVIDDALASPSIRSPSRLMSLENLGYYSATDDPAPSPPAARPLPRLLSFDNLSSLEPPQEKLKLRLRAVNSGMEGYQYNYVHHDCSIEVFRNLPLSLKTIGEKVLEETKWSPDIHFEELGLGPSSWREGMEVLDPDSSTLMVANLDGKIPSDIGLRNGDSLIIWGVKSEVGLPAKQRSRTPVLDSI